jgi:hypothetical protein
MHLHHVALLLAVVSLVVPARSASLCSGRMTALLDKLSVAFTTSNATAMEGLLSDSFAGTFTATGCRSLDRTEFLQALEAKYFGPEGSRGNASNRRVLMPLLELQGFSTGVMHANVAGFAEHPDGTVGWFLDEAVIVVTADPTFTSIAALLWLTPAANQQNSTATEAVYYQLMNASTAKNISLLNDTYSEQLKYYPMLCGSTTPPFPLTKQMTMAAATADIATQRLSVSRTDFVFAAGCGWLAASFMTLFVGDDGRQMVLQDFDVWRLIGDGDFQVLTWLEFGLMNQAPPPTA